MSADCHLNGPISSTICCATSMSVWMPLSNMPGSDWLSMGGSPEVNALILRCMVMQAGGCGISGHVARDGELERLHWSS